MALTNATLNVSQVSGTTDFGKSADYTAYVTTTVSEVTASLNSVLVDQVLSTGNTLAIATTLPITLTPETYLTAYPDVDVTTITAGTTGSTATDSITLVESPSAIVAETLQLDVSAGTYVFVNTGADLFIPGTELSAASGTFVYPTWEITFGDGTILTEGMEISALYQIEYPYEEIVTPIVIRHTVGDDAAIGGTASAVLSAQTTDAIGVASVSSTAFTLSTDETPSDNPWVGYGAFPGETRVETAGRFIDEGII